MTTYTTHDPRIAPAAPASTSYTDRRNHATTAGGFGVGSLVGAGAAILALIAIGGGWVRILSSIAIIALGATLLFESFGIGARYRKVSGGVDSVVKAMGASALTVEFIGGAGGVVLGILALVNIAPVTLMDIAIIGLGAAFALSAGGAFHFGELAGPARRHDDLAVRSLVSTYAASRPVAGMGACILGIVGLEDIGQPHQMLFVLISILAIGSSALLGGMGLGGGHAKQAV